MGCCLSEPISESIEGHFIDENIRFLRRPRSISFYIKNDSVLKNYEDKVLIASIKAYEEDSNIY